VRYVKLSPTKAAAWVDCPRRFFYSYAERRPVKSTWAHFVYGNAVHRCLKQWFDLEPDQRTTDVIEQAITKSWSDDGFRDVDHSHAWRDKAIAVVLAYVANIDPNLEPLASERTLAFKDDACGFVMEGRVDRLDEDGSSVMVVDYKTGKSVPSPDDVRGSEALAMYAVMVQRVLGRHCSSVALHHVPSGNVVSWHHSQESLTRQVDRMGAIASDIRVAEDTWESTDHDDQALDDLFPPKPGGLCGFCDFWNVCAAGQGHASRREPWEGLPELEQV
jgi:hypothetical protein